jgi:hypothetical protein
MMKVILILYLLLYLFNFLAFIMRYLLNNKINFNTIDIIKQLVELPIFVMSRNTHMTRLTLDGCFVLIVSLGMIATEEVFDAPTMRDSYRHYAGFLERAKYWTICE